METIILYKGDKVAINGVLCEIGNGLHLRVPAGHVRVEEAGDDGSTIKIEAPPAK